MEALKCILHNGHEALKMFFKKIILFVYNIEALNKIRTIIQKKKKKN